MPDNTNNDDPLERLKRASQKAQDTSKEQGEKGDPLSLRTIHDKAEDGLDVVGAGFDAAKKYVKGNKTIIGAANRLYNNVKDTYKSFRQASKTFNRIAEAGEAVATFAQPLTKTLGWFCGKLKDAFMWSAYQREPGQFLWNGFKNENGEFNPNPVTHIKGQFLFDEDGDLIFDAKRLGKTALLTMFAAVALNAGVQATYFHSTQFNETVVTTGKNEVFAGEEYTVTGCTDIQCSTDNNNSMYYKINFSWLFPTLLYPEEDVYANIPVDMSVCDLTGYGFYIKELKALHKKLEFYPNIYKADCRPLTQKEIEAGVIDTDLFVPKKQEPVQEQEFINIGPQ